MRSMSSYGVVAVLWVFSCGGLAQPSVQTGRYTTVATGPTEAEREPLKAVIAARFESEVTTVGAAIRATLANTGYVLQETFLVEHAKGLLERPLPGVHRRLSPMTVREAIETLVGSGFQVVVDPMHRTVNLELKAVLADLPDGNADTEPLR